MRTSFRKLVACVALAGAMSGAALWSQEPGKTADTKAVVKKPLEAPQPGGEGAVLAKPVRHFLPAYWSKVVSADQRKAVYAIEDKFGPQIERLETQIAELKAKRLSEMAGVLTPAQRQQVTDLAVGKASK